MVLPVPSTRQDWERLAQDNDVNPTQLFSDCSALPSGSKFGIKHYLPLRILFVDEKSFTVKQRKDFRDSHFPASIREDVLTAMNNDNAIQRVRLFLTGNKKIKHFWNANKYRAVGPFGNGLEKLHQIVSRKEIGKEEPENGDEDTTNLKILASSPAAGPTSSLNKDLTATFQRMSVSVPNDPFRTPPNRSHLSRFPSLNYALDLASEESPDWESPGTDLSSLPGTERRIAQTEFEKAMLVLSDEQTINVCLESLLIPLSNTMGFYDRIVSDRKAFVVPKDETTNLYQACVDGLIKTADRKQIMAFIEVKRKLRSTNDSIFRQIGAQMSAFICSNDHIVNKDRSDHRWMWMVSMEGYQAFITVATYDRNYVDYLFSRPGSDSYNGYMTMTSSKAFDLRVWRHEMEYFFRDVATLMGGPNRNST